MSDAILLEATARTELGKGASRRLRRLENLVPAIIYGGDTDPLSISFLHNKLIKSLENESIYSSVFNVKIGSKKESVILKDIQRHPYKKQIMHMDLQRVSAKEVITKSIPIHFINEDTCKGVKDGGSISHTMTEVEIKCEARKLPEFVEIDMANIEINTVLHLSDLKLAKGVELTADISDSAHNHPVVSIHEVKEVNIEEEEEAVKPEDNSESGSKE